MIYGIAIVCASYVSVRLYERYQDKSRLYKAKKAPKKSLRSKKRRLFLENMLVKTDENARNKHFVSMSAVSVGLTTARRIYPILNLPSILVFTYTAIPYLRQTEKSLIKEKKIDGYVLYSVADMLMLTLGAYVSAAVGIGLLHLSKYILSNAKEQSKKQLVDIFSQQPEKVWLLKDGREVHVPIDEVRANDVLIVNAGDVIPVDGLVVDGIAAVDQKLLTGESQPADKANGDRVYASTMVISGRVSVLMEKSGQDTIVSKIGEIINKSIEFKGTQALKGEQWADSFTLPMMVLAFASWPFLGTVGVVGILYCHIANTIRVVAPLSTLNHLNIAVKNGILVKDGHVLEELTHIDAVIFDKTGTLTQDIPEVGGILSCSDSFTEDEILYYAAAAEQKSVHPIAKAIQHKAEEKRLVLPDIDDSSYEIGYGISVDIDGKTINIGSGRFMDMKSIEISPEVQEKIDGLLVMGHSVIMIAIDGRLSGILEIHTIVRPEAKKAIEALRRSGVKYMAIVSGDHELPTKAIAQSLGMDDYYHSVLPENKAEIVAEIQSKGNKVAFVGDGVNDTIAMEKADVSISLSGASNIATDVATVVLMDGSLLRIPYLVELSRSLEKNLSRSLVLNVVPNVLALSGVLFLRFEVLTTMLISQSPLVLGTINAILPADSETSDLDTDEELKLVNGSTE